MPFKTPYGSHYHMTEGCHGATIPCGTEGLSPCSDCCGDGGGHASATDVSIALAGGGVAFVYDFDEQGEYDDIAPCKYCGSRPYRSIAGIMCKNCGYEVSWAGRTGRQLNDEWNADPDDGTPRADPTCAVEVAAGNATGFRAMPTPDIGPKDESEYFARRAASSATRSATLAKDPMPATPAKADDLPTWPEGKEPLGAVIAPGIVIQPDGRITRASQAPATSAQAARDAGNELARRVSASLGDGYATGRAYFVRELDKATRNVENRHDRDQMRLMAQRTWNVMHPEAKVLEWSRDSETYAMDSPLAVMRQWRSMGEDGREEVTYTLHSKVDGSDLTREVADLRDAASDARRQMDAIRSEARDRAERTGELVLYTSEQRKTMGVMRDRIRRAEGRLDEIEDEYDLTTEMIYVAGMTVRAKPEGGRR